LHPPIEPFAHGVLPLADGTGLYWEQSGRRDGAPALYLHGGPGGGLGLGGYRRRFDPSVYRVVGFDQRGCGRSLPLAIDALERLDANTTHTLIADIEALREHLGIDAWLVHGVSWGSTLALAYALEHPERVRAIVLTAVTSGSREEVDWLTEGVGRIFPEAWSRFAAVAQPGERLVQTYARLLRHPDPSVRTRAADAWDEWESTHVSLDPNWSPGPHRDEQRDRENFATLVTHYWANDCFLPGDRRVLDRMQELAGIPGVLVHGRHDVSGPAITAWELHRRWPGSRLIVVESEGHGGPEMMQLTADAIDELAPRLSASPEQAF
jgi:proline iminopeptidase